MCRNNRIRKELDMNPRESKLMNFRIPVDLKDQFNEICEYKNIKMSFQLKQLIRSFINKESKKYLKTEPEPNPDQQLLVWGHQVYNPLTKVWSVIKGA